MIVPERVLALGLLLIKTHYHLTKLHVTEVDLTTYIQYQYFNFNFILYSIYKFFIQKEITVLI